MLSKDNQIDYLIVTNYAPHNLSIDEVYRFPIIHAKKAHIREVEFKCFQNFTLACKGFKLFFLAIDPSRWKHNKRSQLTQG